MFVGTKRIIVIAFFTLVLIVLVNLAWWLYYNRTERMLENQLSLRLQSVARTVALALPPEQVENLALDDIEAFDVISDRLESVREADSLAEVFILDENYHYLVTTVLEADSVYFLRDLNGVYIDSLFFGFTSEALVSPAYKTGRLYLKSAFAPLYNPEGFLTAVLGVEASVDYFDDLSALKRNLYFSSALAVIGGLVLGIIFLLLQVRISHTEQKLILGESHAFMGRMVAVVAHELKNPLMIIRASAERLAKRAPSEGAGYIVEEVDRLDGIVTGYLDFARGDGSLLRGENLETFAPEVLLDSLKKHLDERYPAGSIEWVKGSPSGSFEITAYRRSLRQVIMNLLINGAEACLEAEKPVKLDLAANLKNDRVEFIITDFGRGVSKKDMKKIFSPFYTTKQNGSGLGLYLSRKIIDEMGGELKIKSEPGVKTEVIIKIPKEPGK
ncbi:MAG: HAMP domain-containing histidine kinase [candidate division Zixibacteria bacterium]|nr:HAMP domain-containing histidine kinase [candidate division Zixibacteria bacterium]